jgi:hypothetical protein
MIDVRDIADCAINALTKSDYEVQAYVSRKQQKVKRIFRENEE